MDNESETFEESEELVVDPDLPVDEHTLIGKLKEFSYYLVDEVEINLDFCLKLIEAKGVPQKPNSKYIFILSKIASVIPKIGGGLGTALSQTENFFLNRIDKKNSRTLADLVYFFSDNRDDLRQILIEASADVFCSFEDQFKKVTCEGGGRRAMQKLAKTASGRIFNYLLEQKELKEITKKDFILGILEGESKANRTVKVDEKNWKTSDIFRKAGVVFLDTKAFFKNPESRSQKYGYRQSFPWETMEEIEKSYEVDNSPHEIPKYMLKIRQELLTDIRDYILMKDPFGKEKLEREKDTEKLGEIMSQYYEGILQILREHYHEILDEFGANFSTTVGNQKIQTSMLETVLNNQDEDKKVKYDITTKLELIHQDVIETRDNQIVIMNSTNELREDIDNIQTIQQELSEREVVPALVQEVREILRNNDPGPSIRREAERTIDRSHKELKRFERRVRKLF